MVLLSLSFNNFNCFNWYDCFNWFTCFNMFNSFNWFILFNWSTGSMLWGSNQFRLVFCSCFKKLKRLINKMILFYFSIRFLLEWLFVLERFFQFNKKFTQHFFFAKKSMMRTHFLFIKIEIQNSLSIITLVNEDYFIQQDDKSLLIE